MKNRYHSRFGWIVSILICAVSALAVSACQPHLKISAKPISVTVNYSYSPEIRMVLGGEEMESYSVTYYGDLVYEDSYLFVDFVSAGLLDSGNEMYSSDILASYGHIQNTAFDSYSCLPMSDRYVAGDKATLRRCFDDITSVTFDVVELPLYCSVSFGPSLFCDKENLTIKIDSANLSFTASGTATDQDRQWIIDVLKAQNIDPSILPDVIMADANYLIPLP